MGVNSTFTDLDKADQVTRHMTHSIHREQGFSRVESSENFCLLSVVTKIYIVSSVIRSPKFIMQKKSHHGICNSSLDSRLHAFGLAFC